MNTWQIDQIGFDVRSAQAYEGLFTLGSGYLQTRASLEEHMAECPQNSCELRRPVNVTAEEFAASPARWGTYVPGVFGHHPLLLQEMINLPWFLELAPIVNGERLDVTRCDIRRFRRTLNMQTATLTRELTWRVPTGATVRVAHERFVSGAHPHLSLQRMRIESDAPVEVVVRAGIDANVTTNGFNHFRSVVMGGGIKGLGVTCEVRTDADERVCMESRASASVSAEWTCQTDSLHAWSEAVFQLDARQPLLVEKRTTVTTSRDPQATTPFAILKQVAARTWDELHSEHLEHWARAWRHADVEIEGDDEAQRVMRTSIYHLLRAHVPGDDRVAIGAKGHAGEAYKGHFFWDTEVYLLPFYLYTMPEKAKTLVQFRIRNLPEALKLAASFGYRGARYPWESDADGRECCSSFQYSDHEIHVTADVIYGLAHYFAATDGGLDNLPEPAARVVVETARYWFDRVDWRAGDSHPSLLGVMGPDEYAPITHNNAYTNRLAAFNLALAARVGERGGAKRDEVRNFAEIAAALPLPRSDRNPKLILQCEGFEKLADPRFDELWPERKGCYAARVSQERLYRSKNLKQADVLLLMAMLPNEFTDEEVKTAWDYYLPVTTHDSSLSAGIHALVALRLDRRDDAWRFFRQAAFLDLDTEHGGAAQGIHIAGCAANWQVAVHGFAGLENGLQNKVLSLNPKLPSAWRRLAFPVVWKGTPLRVEIGRGFCEIRNHGENPIDATVWGKPCRLPPNQVLRVDAPHSPPTRE